MIEIRSDVVDLSRIKNDMLHSVAMVERMKKAGVPVIGVLHMRGVSRGKLTWHLVEDLDGDISIMTWYDTNERDSDDVKWEMVSHTQHEGYTITVWRDPSIEDEEL